MENNTPNIIKPSPIERISGVPMTTEEVADCNKQLADFVYLLGQIDKANKARNQNDNKNQ